MLRQIFKLVDNLRCRRILLAIDDFYIALADNLPAGA
jgi:hypothetical protein